MAEKPFLERTGVRVALLLIVGIGLLILFGLDPFEGESRVEKPSAELIRATWVPRPQVFARPEGMPERGPTCTIDGHWQVRPPMRMQAECYHATYGRIPVRYSIQSPEAARAYRESLTYAFSAQQQPNRPHIYPMVVSSPPGTSFPGFHAVWLDGTNCGSWDDPTVPCSTLNRIDRLLQPGDTAIITVYPESGINDLHGWELPFRSGWPQSELTLAERGNYFCQTEDLAFKDALCVRYAPVDRSSPPGPWRKFCEYTGPADPPFLDQYGNRDVIGRRTYAANMRGCGDTIVLVHEGGPNAAPAAIEFYMNSSHDAPNAFAGTPDLVYGQPTSWGNCIQGNCGLLMLLEFRPSRGGAR